MKTFERFQAIKEKVVEKKSSIIASAVTLGSVALVSGVTASATDGTTPASFTITAELVQPVVNAINSGLETLIPIGLGIMGTFIGVRLIKRVIYMFL